LIAFAAMHGSPAILTTDFGPSGKPMRRREFITWLGGAQAGSDTIPVQKGIM
jgi:hypothetical protein